MKKMLCIVALLSTTTIHSAHRQNIQPVTIPEQLSTQEPQIIYIPVPVSNPTQTYSDEQQQRDLFLTFMSIAGNFGKILLDPQDTPHVIEGVNTIIDAIVYAADIATRAQTRSRSHKDFIETVARAIQRRAQEFMECLPDDYQKDARELLIDYTLTH